MIFGETSQERTDITIGRSNDSNIEEPDSGINTVDDVGDKVSQSDRDCWYGAGAPMPW